MVATGAARGPSAQLLPAGAATHGCPKFSVVSGVMGPVGPAASEPVMTAWAPKEAATAAEARRDLTRCIWYPSRERNMTFVTGWPSRAIPVTRGFGVGAVRQAVCVGNVASKRKFAESDGAAKKPVGDGSCWRGVRRTRTPA